jgi:hypothetical protein
MQKNHIYLSTFKGFLFLKFNLGHKYKIFFEVFLETNTQNVSPDTYIIVCQENRKFFLKSLFPFLKPPETILNMEYISIMSCWVMGYAGYGQVCFLLCSACWMNS